MTPNQLMQRMLAADPDGEYLLYAAGIAELYHLGESGIPGLHLIDATPEQILSFVESNRGDRTKQS